MQSFLLVHSSNIEEFVLVVTFEVLAIDFGVSDFHTDPELFQEGEEVKGKHKHKDHSEEHYYFTFQLYSESSAEVHPLDVRGLGGFFAFYIDVKQL